MISFCISYNNGTRLPSAKWPLVTKQLRTITTCWHQPLSWSCLPVCTTARRAKEPIYGSVSCEHNSQTAFRFFSMSCFVPGEFGDRTQMFPLLPHISLLILHKLPAVKPYPAEYHVFDINYMSEPHESH